MLTVELERLAHHPVLQKIERARSGVGFLFHRRQQQRMQPRILPLNIPGHLPRIERLARESQARDQGAHQSRHGHDRRQPALTPSRQHAENQDSQSQQQRHPVKPSQPNRKPPLPITFDNRFESGL
jgi:hypothetical protein